MRLPSFEMACKLIGQNRKFYNDHLREKTRIVRWPCLILLYIDLIFPKTLILGCDYIYRYRRDEAEPAEVLRQSNKQDLIIFLIFLFVIGSVFIPREIVPILFIAVGIYRLLDIICQRLRNIFIDPYFHEGGGHLVDRLRSFIWAILNYIEMIFIFAIFYKYLPDGTFNLDLTGFGLVYFSFITITTVGFGDIYPNPDATFAKSLICFEIAFGILFVIIVLGTLVTILSESYGKIYGSQKKSDRNI
jgi:ABC-type multidrug transport system fused ATPase/permease subunit